MKEIRYFVVSFVSKLAQFRERSGTDKILLDLPTYKRNSDERMKKMEREREGGGEKEKVGKINVECINSWLRERKKKDRDAFKSDERQLQ